MTKTSITARALAALAVLRDNPGVSPQEFAVLFWPESPGFMRYSKCGSHGSTRGGGMRLSAGGYLARLKNRGLVYANSLDQRGNFNDFSPHYRLTEDGLAELRKSVAK